MQSLVARSSLVAACLTFLALATLPACGDSSSSSSSFKCCVNGSYYKCNSESDFSHCSKADMTAFCPRDTSGDSQCK